jgi:NTE family protein
VGAVLLGWLLPFRRPSDFLARAYERHLFGRATLRDLPTDAEGPRFTLYATSLQTGASVRFSRPYMAEYHLGQILDPEVPLAVAVAASSAFPPLFCPLELATDPARWVADETADLSGSAALRSRMMLGDGGIYDNLGLERVWDRHDVVLVSDAGAPFAVKERSLALRFSQVARTRRVLDIAVEQTRALRRRRVVGDLEAGTRRGAYWGISTVIAGYELQAHGRAAPLLCDSDGTRALAQVRTRLNAFGAAEQAALINWGYALCDAALRRYVLSEEPAAGALPVEPPAASRT